MTMEILALGYLGIHASQPAAWATYGPEVFGFQLAGQDSDGSVYLKMDDRQHRIAIHPHSDDGLAYMGWELRDLAAFDDAIAHLERCGVRVDMGDDALCRQRGVRGMASFDDPAEFRHEIFYGQRFSPSSFLPGRAISGFVADELGVGHVVVVVPELTQELHDFALNVLGMSFFGGGPTARRPSRSKCLLPMTQPS
jgi:hypothetical protein